MKCGAHGSSAHRCPANSPKVSGGRLQRLCKTGGKEVLAPSLSRTTLRARIPRVRPELRKEIGGRLLSGKNSSGPSPWIFSEVSASNVPGDSARSLNFTFQTMKECPVWEKILLNEEATSTGPSPLLIGINSEREPQRKHILTSSGVSSGHGFKTLYDWPSDGPMTTAKQAKLQLTG